MVTQFGQFLDHDITLTPEEDLECDCGESDPEEDCFNIPIPTTDPFFPLLSSPQVTLPPLLPIPPLLSIPPPVPDVPPLLKILSLLRGGRQVEQLGCQ